MRGDIFVYPNRQQQKQKCHVNALQPVQSKLMQKKPLQETKGLEMLQEQLGS